MNKAFPSSISGANLNLIIDAPQNGSCFCFQLSNRSGMKDSAQMTHKYEKFKTYIQFKVAANSEHKSFEMVL